MTRDLAVDLARVCELVHMTCSLQTRRLPATDPAYPLTCSNPFVGLVFFTFQNLEPLKPKP